jgi:hypothetical protein
MVKRLFITLLGVLLMLAGLALLMGAAVCHPCGCADRLAVDPTYLDASQLTLRRLSAVSLGRRHSLPAAGSASRYALLNHGECRSGSRVGQRNTRSQQ